MNKFGITCAALAIFGFTTLSAKDVEAKVVAINAEKHTITVASPAIEGEGGKAVITMDSIPDGLTVGSPVVVTWNKERAAFVIVRKDRKE